ncbi:cell division protein FtsZ [Breoghania corrubedonensis]|uniref:Cell division protein FtsZ n=2 Tax=Breoghania corrubedonensis TaxID=665038 RepID=A0A2T5V4X0_9HYPH|nr:cell division protein FtsZ [Breoghania corrubedonensis]
MAGNEDEEAGAPASGRAKDYEEVMTINLQIPDITELKPRITVFGVGGAGGNAVNNMIQAGLQGCDFVVANTDAQALTLSQSDRVVQMGVAVTEGLGAGSQPEVGRAAAEEVLDEINDHLAGAHMVFITGGMGGGTGTGAAPVIARAAREQGILTVGVVTKPFHFEGQRRMRLAEHGIQELQQSVDTLIVIPNQNLFRIANEQTTFADAFAMADQVLYSGVACVTDLMVKEGLINLDFADVRSIMRGMGKAMMGTGESTGDNRAMLAAEAAIANPLLDETSMKGAKGLLISITGGRDMTLFEVDEAATRIREEVDEDANIIMGATFDESLEGTVRVSVVATGIDREFRDDVSPAETRMSVLTERLKAVSAPEPKKQERIQQPVASRPAPAAVVAEDALEAELSGHHRPTSVASDPDVTIEAYQPNPGVVSQRDMPLDFDEVPAAPAPREEPAAEPYIPPTAEAVTGRRMPEIDDFPPIVHAEIRQSMGVAAEEHEHAHAPAHGHGYEEEDDRRPMSLLRRLASGLGRREEHEDYVHEEQAYEPQPVPQQAAPRQAAPQPAAPQPAPQPVHNEYAKRPTQAAAGRLDPHGRPAPQARQQTEDDQLEIPAFLRRQAN